MLARRILGIKRRSPLITRRRETPTVSRLTSTITRLALPGAKYFDIRTPREDLDFINFYLYPNFGLSEEENPSLKVQKVTARGRELYYSLRAHSARLRVELPQKLQPGQGIELTLDFSARVPRVQREETSLLAHFLQEVGDALNDERQPKDARDIFFAGEEAMLLG